MTVLPKFIRGLCPDFLVWEYLIHSTLDWITFTSNDRFITFVGEITFTRSITFVGVTETFNIFVKDINDWLEETLSSICPTWINFHDNRTEKKIVLICFLEHKNIDVMSLIEKKIKIILKTRFIYNVISILEMFLYIMF